MLAFLEEHQTSLIAGSFVQVLGLLLSAPISTFDSTVAPVFFGLLVEHKTSLITGSLVEILGLLLGAPVGTFDSTVAPVFSSFLVEHQTSLMLGSLVEILGFLLSAPVGSLDAAIAPVLLLVLHQLFSVDLLSSNISDSAIGLVNKSIELVDLVVLGIHLPVVNVLVEPVSLLSEDVLGVSGLHGGDWLSGPGVLLLEVSIVPVVGSGLEKSFGVLIDHSLLDGGDWLSGEGVLLLEVSIEPVSGLDHIDVGLDLPEGGWVEDLSILCMDETIEFVNWRSLD